MPEKVSHPNHKEWKWTAQTFNNDDTTVFQNVGTVCPKKYLNPKDFNHHTACSSIKRKHPIDVIMRLEKTQTPVCTKHEHLCVLSQHLFYLMMQSASQDYSIMWQIFTK